MSLFTQSYMRSELQNAYNTNTNDTALDQRYMTSAYVNSDVRLRRPDI